MQNVRYTAYRYGVHVTVSPELAAEAVLAGQTVRAQIVGMEYPYIEFERMSDPDPNIEREYVMVYEAFAVNKKPVTMGIGEIELDGKRGQFYLDGKAQQVAFADMESAINFFALRTFRAERTPAIDWRELSSFSFGLGLFVNGKALYRVEQGDLQDSGEYVWEVWQGASKLICICDEVEHATQIAELLGKQRLERGY